MSRALRPLPGTFCRVPHPMPAAVTPEGGTYPNSGDTIMIGLFARAAGLAALFVLPQAAGAADVAKSPPDAPYQQVSKLVKLPDFIPGLGQLFVDPATLPAGPFLAYDRDGALVSTIYMVPVADLNPDKKFDDLAAPGGEVDHVDIYFNAGHPGVEQPHAHVVLWHVGSDGEARVAAQ
jgi:hypothetical protein